MRPTYKQLREPVEQWLRNLPLAPRLCDACPSENLSDLASLTPEQVKEVTRLFVADFEIFLQEELTKLKNALTIVHDRASNPKFQIYQGNFGFIKDFHIPLYDDIGSPNPAWLEGMRLEHIRDTDLFTTSNYHIETCPAREWANVVDGMLPEAGHMAGGRIIKDIDVLLGLPESVRAGLTRAEVIALVLYTGPMFLIYNTVLRKFPHKKYADLKSKDNLFPTTICVLVSAVQKLSRTMVLEPGTVLYRGLDGNMELPSQCFVPDEIGCRGMMEFGFMSTTTDINTAFSYSNIENSKAPKALAITVSSVDRGADISQYSQYPSEKEILWTPHAFLEPTGGSELIITEKGVVQLIRMKVNAHMKAVVIEEYERKKMDLHMAAFKVQLLDLQTLLNEMNCTAKDEETTKRFKVKCLEEYNDVRERHRLLTVTEYNKDTVYRGLVTDMLDFKKFAIAKMEYMLACAKANEEKYSAKPLRMVFRDHMGLLVQRLESNPNAVEALHLCKLHGLVVETISERNEMGETPLISAIADGVTDEKLELLLDAGSDVNFTMDYSGKLRKHMTPLLTASMYGRTSMIPILATRGANLRAENGDEVTGLFYAAEYGFKSTVEVLARLGADVNKPNKYGWTPVYRSAQRGHKSTVELLGRLGADVNKPDKDGCTPLYVAAQSGYESVVRTLLGLGADPSIASRHGCTPCDRADELGHTAVVEVLKATDVRPARHTDTAVT